MEHDWHPYKKGKFGQRPCEQEGSDQCDVPISQAMPKIASKLPKARRVVWNRFSLTAQKEPTLTFGLQNWEKINLLCKPLSV